MKYLVIASSEDEVELVRSDLVKSGELFQVPKDIILKLSDLPIFSKDLEGEPMPHDDWKEYLEEQIEEERRKYFSTLYHSASKF